MKIEVFEQFSSQGVLISVSNWTPALTGLEISATCTPFYLFIVSNTPFIILKVKSKQLVSEFSHRKKNGRFFF